MPDGVSDLTILIKMFKGGMEANKFLQELQDTNTRKFEKDTIDLYRDWVIELDKSFAVLKKEFSNIERLIEEQFQDREFRLLMKNFHLEAAREAIDERRKMLAHATAGACAPRPNLNLARRARLERVVRELDPDDVRALYGLSLVVGRYDLEGKDYGATERLRLHVLESLPNGDALLASGLVNVDHRLGWGGVGAKCSLAPLGIDLLLLLKTYVLKIGPSFDVPGRQVLPGDRTEEEARAYLEKIDGVRILLSKLSEVNQIGKQYVFPFGRAPGSKEESPLLLFNVFAPMRRAEFLDLAQSFTNTELRFRIEDGSADHFRLMLFGQHDILRLIADDCNASWC